MGAKPFVLTALPVLSYSLLHRTQSSSLGFPLDALVLDEKWARLVDSHFGDLEREMTTMVTKRDAEGNVMVDYSLLEELGWGKPGRRTKFEDLLKGARPSTPSRSNQPRLSRIFACITSLTCTIADTLSFAPPFG